MLRRGFLGGLTGLLGALFIAKPPKAAAPPAAETQKLSELVTSPSGDVEVQWDFQPDVASKADIAALSAQLDAVLEQNRMLRGMTCYLCDVLGVALPPALQAPEPARASTANADAIRLRTGLDLPVDAHAVRELLLLDVASLPWLPCPPLSMNQHATAVHACLVDCLREKGLRILHGYCWQWVDRKAGDARPRFSIQVTAGNGIRRETFEVQGTF